MSNFANSQVIIEKKMKKLLYLLIATLVMAACGQSYEEKRKLSRQERLRLMRQDSAALKIAVMPTLDCLPLFVARHHQLFEAAGADIRLKQFTAQMDCDTAIAGGSVEGCVTDLVRAERLKKQGTPLRYMTRTDAYWQLFSNRMARIKELRQLDDKMVGATRFSATDMLTSMAVDSCKMKTENVYRIQVNDVHIRLKMLMADEEDAAWLTEPQATEARLARHRLMTDSRGLKVQLGAIAFREVIFADSTRQKQIEVFKKAYNQACDSLKRYGTGRYRDVIITYCKMKPEQADSLPKDLQFHHITAPADDDIKRAQEWLNKQ